MPFSASVLLSLALAVRPDSGLRIVNPHPVPVQVTLTCDAQPRTWMLAPRDLVDVPAQTLCASPVLDAPLPLLALQTEGEDEQRVLGGDETCSPQPMSVPLFACARGDATAAVPMIEGATYEWSAEGATIVGPANTNRIAVAIGEGTSATLTSIVTRDGCRSESRGVIAIRKPLAIHQLQVPAETDANAEVTVQWSYEPGAAPNAQILAGDAFPQPVTLTPEQRSYTFTPAISGARTIELQASYANAIRPSVPNGGRRRAVGSTLTTATNCPSARATAPLLVRGCTLDTVDIVAPDDVESGSHFFASIAGATSNDTIRWEVRNGTLVGGGFGPQVEVRVDDFVAEIELIAHVERASDCKSQAVLTVHVHAPAACATNPPVATLSLSNQSCSGATLHATFSGTPPFSGRWFDGQPFETRAATLSREVTGARTYGLASFRDASCSGSSDTVTLVSMQPSATLSVVGRSCPEGKIVATFTGVPPFSGKWLDGTSFTTSAHTLERTNPAPGYERIHGLSDANCYAGEPSNTLYIESAPTLHVPDEPVCFIDNLAPITLEMYGGIAPYTVEWADGVVTTSRFATIARDYAGDATQLEIVRAHTGTCDAQIPNPIVNVLRRPRPRIDEARTSDVVCVMKSGVAALANAQPGAQFEWSANNATITGGQGTAEVTFQGNSPAGLPIDLFVTASYPDGFCASTGRHWIFVDDDSGEIAYLRPVPASIPAGGSAVISFRLVGAVREFSAVVEPASRQNDLKFDRTQCTNDGICEIPYVDSHGPGTVRITLPYSGSCIADGAASTDLIITQ